MPNDVSVVILAAGQGTRMKSRMAKVLHRAGGRALVEHAIAAAKGVAPPERIFVVVGHQAEAVREVAEAAGVKTFEQKEQLGTGHAMLCGEPVLSGLGGRIVVTVGDCPLIRAETLEALVEKQRDSQAAAVVLTADVPDSTGYGRIIRDHNGAVTAIVEEKAATPAQRTVREINSGIYCFDANEFWRHVRMIGADNPAREYYLTDMIEILNRTGLRVGATKIADPGELLGINDRVQLADADRILRARKTRELMISGVTIEKPETVTIDLDVKIGMDTIIGPFAWISGQTVIGEDCRIGACAILHDAVIEDGAEVFAFSMVSGSKLGVNAHAGPYARLRLGAELGDEAHVGNFVELKNTRIGAKSKSMHLAYLGDSEIGSGVNIGAGTITCNYDGKKKHKTKIGDGAFVGSNSTLVAPIEVEGGSYIAAGSVITEKVPAGSLALGRARQVVKTGWKRKES
ncbi:MAG TPA: bifunctional UDP-N-acetylglucosamine diphosphorylase/glucosamine-1-phosphate N-acetyltransferase GlmU [Bryobacteraceae bacterium]|nr:bifunctional UDP-N-acetylglucosamine diphosphorylase/glucosamine-1-phosphate N-acetyltransferase GlmU [Bryobacteraceae bacterium]